MGWGAGESSEAKKNVCTKKPFCNVLATAVGL